MNRPLFYLIVLLVIVTDQAFKGLVQMSMHGGQTFPIIKNIFHFTYVQNSGAAFGLLSNYPWLLLGIVIAVSLLIIIYHFDMAPNDYYQLPLAFILGGSLGNLIDRARLGYVVDYLDFRFWPVFNLADIMINVGVFLILARLLLKREVR